MRHKHIVVSALAVFILLPLTGCGGGSSSTTTTSSPLTSQLTTPDSLVGTYSAAWSLPNTSEAGTFQFTITQVPSATNSAVSAIQFTSTGTMPPNVGALSLQASPSYSGQVTTVADGSTTEISQVNFQPYVAQPSWGLAYVILNISSTNVITGTINDYAGGLTNVSNTPYHLTVTKIH